MKVKSSTLAILFFIVCSMIPSTSYGYEDCEQMLLREISLQEKCLHECYKLWHSNKKSFNKKKRIHEE